MDKNPRAGQIADPDLRSRCRSPHFKPSHSRTTNTHFMLLQHQVKVHSSHLKSCVRSLKSQSRDLKPRMFDRHRSLGSASGYDPRYFTHPVAALVVQHLSILVRMPLPYTHEGPKSSILTRVAGWEVYKTGRWASQATSCSTSCTSH